MSCNCTDLNSLVNQSNSILGGCYPTPTFSSGGSYAGVLLTGSTFTVGTITGSAFSGGAITGSSVRGLPEPTLSGDAATKSYVDGLSYGGPDIHEACLAATTADVTLSGGAPSTVDGQTLSAGSRVLVKDQTNPVQNGIYFVSTLGSGANGTWTRTADAASATSLQLGSSVQVQYGTLSGNSIWNVTSSVSAIGTSDIVWTEVFGLTTVPATKLTGDLDPSRIPSGALDITKFASGITPVEIVAALPAAGSQGRTVFLTTDNKLYRDTGVAWTAAVPTVDLSGTIDAETQVTAGSIKALNIAAGAITAGKLDANSVTAGTIAAGAVNTGELAAGAVTAGKISVTNLAAISADIGTITAGSLTAATSISVGTGVDQVQLSSTTFTYGGTDRLKFMNTAGNVLFKAIKPDGVGGDYVALRSESNGSGLPANIEFASGFAQMGLITCTGVATFIRLNLAKTITGGGTTGNQTIDKATGSVNFAAAATSLVVTNSLVTAGSVIIVTLGTNDATARLGAAVAAAGSFTIYMTAAPTAETRVNFLVTN